MTYKNHTTGFLAVAIMAAAIAGSAVPAANAAGAATAAPKAPIAKLANSKVHKIGHRRGFRFGKFKRHGFGLGRFPHDHSFGRVHFGHGHGCGFYKRKWLWTGKFFWKKKYFLCRGWW